MERALWKYVVMSCSIIPFACIYSQEYTEFITQVGESLNLLGTVQLKQGEVKQAIKSLTKVVS